MLKRNDELLMKVVAWTVWPLAWLIRTWFAEPRPQPECPRCKRKVTRDVAEALRKLHGDGQGQGPEQGGAC
jgi:hypothetical protein